MQTVKERDGVPQSEQVRRALREWLEKRGVLPPPARPDPDIRNADWSKKTRDVDVDGKPVARRTKKGARR